ncbi:MAG: response regulator transcription factor [Zoogloeaceae bacterium]|jgi:DNA-binding response OmpR family regulator|nr:response regulator transcription factor [Zoogloeaceae bacterium]
MQLLLVEDDALLGDGLRAALNRAGFGVTWVKDGKSALAVAGSGNFAAIVLDIGLPALSGMDVLGEIRAAGNHLPVLVLTARDSTRDKVIGLEQGADDYVVKTADMEELIARLRALIRRTGRASGVIRVGELSLDLTTHTATRDGKPITLSVREAAVLRMLMERAGRVITRHQLAEVLYGWGKSVESNAIEVHIHNLRSKLGGEIVKTVRGIGYTISKPAQ